MRKLLCLVSTLTLSAAAKPVHAVNSQAGTSAAQFLKIGAGSRAAGMAEAYAALADDAYALYYNPAALTLLPEPQLAAAHTAYFQGASYEVVGFAYPSRRGGERSYSRHALGAAVYNLSIADIERRTGDTAATLGSFGSGDYSYNLSYAYRFDRTFGFGTNVKLIQQNIDSFSSTALAADVGALYTPQPDAARPVRCALVVKNVGTRPALAGGVSDPLPVGATFGAGWHVLPKRLRVELDLSKYRDTDPFFSSGGEYLQAFGEGFSGALRAGYSSQRKDNAGLNGVSLGMGVNFHRASFDFAWVPFGDLGNTFRYSLLIRFGGT